MDLHIDARAWTRVRSRFGTTRRPKTFDETMWLGTASYWYPMEVWAPIDWTYLIICMKSECVRWWWKAGGAHPRDLAVVGAYYSNDPRVAAVIQPLFAAAAATAYLGDMDPLSIVRYVETRRALNHEGRPPLLYGGVDDAWLAAMECALTPRLRFEALSIRLSKEEVALLKGIERALDLESLVGPRSSAMLRSGYKIELEGATNPGLFRANHRPWAFRHLRSLCERASGGPLARRKRARTMRTPR